MLDIAESLIPLFKTIDQGAIPENSTLTGAVEPPQRVVPPLIKADTGIA